MTDHDAPDTHPVDDTIAEALRRAERQADRNATDDTLDAARSARDRHARDRRRRIRVATFGAAAAVLLAVVGVAVTLSRDNGTRSVASDTGGLNAALMVEPSTGLVDGQKVAVHMAGFDDGEPLRVMQCATRRAGDWLCDGDDVERPLPGPTSPERSAGERVVTTTVTVHTELEHLMLVSRDAAGIPRFGTVDPRDPTGVSCEAGADPPRDQAACVIVVLGERDGTSVVEAAPIWFGSDGTSGPATTAPSNGSTQGPDDLPPQQSSVPAQTIPPAPSSAPGQSGGTMTQPSTASESSMCPGTVPAAPRPSGSDGTSPLLAFTPRKVIICEYAEELYIVRTVSDSATLSTIRSDLNALEAVPDEVMCTAEKSADFAVVASAGSRTSTIWVQSYGCGFAFSGDHLRMGAKSLSWLAG